jgi:hypothetical protein
MIDVLAESQPEAKGKTENVIRSEVDHRACAVEPERAQDRASGTRQTVRELLSAPELLVRLTWKKAT